MTLKQYCEQNNLDENKVFNMVLARGADILPTVTAFTGYMTEIKDDCIVCTNDKLNVFNKEIPFSSFQSAEFGIGSGQLWLQCIVDGKDFIFCSPRKSWKSPAAKLLLEKSEKKLKLEARKNTISTLENCFLSICSNKSTLINLQSVNIYAKTKCTADFFRQQCILF